ncbi:MAG: 5-formyltetrahydrofolate cyclo-ligase [Rhodothermaceae bacterium]|nr:MAG: 5-formyltetrahydrofolate cyclo-ligase [Rhodothermaceae bacterium]
MKPSQTPSDLRTEKAALRARFRAYRAALDPRTHVALSRAITERLTQLPVLDRARVIHVFWPHVERREVDLRPLIRSLAAADKQIVLPVVVTPDRNGDARPRLRHVRFTGEAALTPNRWGIHEPSGGESVPPERLDLVIVPALGAGRNGHRLGYGGGYYDAFLAGLDIPTICPVYDACLVDQVPAEAHDVPVRLIVTEKEVITVP